MAEEKAKLEEALDELGSLAWQMVLQKKEQKRTGGCLKREAEDEDDKRRGSQEQLVDSLRKQVNKKEEDLKLKRANECSLERELNDARNKQKSQELELEELKSEQSAVKDAVQKLKQENDLLRTQVAEQLGKEQSKHANEIQKQKEKMEQQQKEELQRLKQEHKNQMDKMCQEKDKALDDLKKKLKVMKTNNDMLKTKKEEENRINKQLCTRNEELIEKNKEQHEEIEKLKEDNSKIISVTDECSRLDHEYRKLKQKFQSQMAKPTPKQNLKDAFKVTAQKLTLTRKVYQDLRKCGERLKETPSAELRAPAVMDNLRDILGRMRQAGQDAEHAKVEQLEAKLLDAGRRSAKMRQTFEELLKDVENAREFAAHVNSKFSDLEQKNSRLQMEKEELKQQMQETDPSLEREIGDLRAQKADLEERLEKHQLKTDLGNPPSFDIFNLLLSEKQQQVTQLRRDCARLTDECQKMRVSALPKPTV